MPEPRRGKKERGPEHFIMRLNKMKY